MIAQLQRDSAAPAEGSVTSVATSALTRIPTSHFRDLAWARDAIATCLSIVNGALAGDRPRAMEWVREIAPAPDAASKVAVLSAVCDAIVADAFRRKSDVRAISNFVCSFEQAVFVELATHRKCKDFEAMYDSNSVELAAGLVRVVRMHDSETAIHLEATGVLARRIAQTMDLPIEQVGTIELAARLHDIGKVGVPKAVLCKPGRLTAAEWREMRLHAEVGAAVLFDTPKLAHLAPIVRAHHERMDGTGYPDRLRAHEIPLESRVIAVADAFHAMTTERCYSRAIMPSNALDVLADNAGPQFDVDVVAATFELFRYARRTLRAIA